MKELFRGFSKLVLLTLTLITLLTPGMAWDGPMPVCPTGQICRAAQ